MSTMTSLSGQVLTILTEGDRRRGLGHVVRCSAYAQIWRDRGGLVRWVLDGDEAAARVASSLGEVTLAAWQHLDDPLASIQTDAAIIDSYSLSEGAARAASLRRRRLAFIDDRQAFPYPKSLVVHALPDPAPLREDEAEWLVGPYWQPLRRPFRDAAPRRAIAPDIRRILIIMGGTDVAGLGPRVARLTAGLRPDSEVRLVGGLGDGDQSQAYTALGPLTDVQMVEEMLACDLAVSAAGQTTLELARCGAPTVMIGVVDNQRPNLDHWPALAGFINAGFHDEPDLQGRLRAAIEALSSQAVRHDVSSRAAAQVDGQGAARLIDRLSEE